MQNKARVCRWLSWFGAVFVASGAMAADVWQMNMYQGVTPISHDMYHLHVLAMIVCSGIGVVVFGVMIYALIRHRKSRGHQSVDFHENIKLEIFWTVVPFLILIGLAIPATKVLIQMDNTDQSALTIKVVGHQWNWEYTYLDQDIHFYSNLATTYAAIHNQVPKGEWYLLEVDRPIVVPVHKKIRFLVTSDDVIHSWWVPELGIKRDAIPGFMHEAWANIERPGIYRGQCTELCGINHGFMPIEVKAVTEQEFDLWVKQQADLKKVAAKQAASTKSVTLTRKALMTLGKTKYEQMCSACHLPSGLGMPPVYPALKGSSVAVGHPISRHIDIILSGVAGSAMQPYGEQLTDEEIAAITTYERNAWNNNTNDLVQPQDVRAVRRAHDQKPTMVTKAQAGGLR